MLRQKSFLSIKPVNGKIAQQARSTINLAVVTFVGNILVLCWVNHLNGLYLENLILQSEFCMKAINKLSIFLVGSLMLLAALAPAVTTPALLMPPGIGIMRSSNSIWLSTNWSGYALTAAKAQ